MFTPKSVVHGFRFDRSETVIEINSEALFFTHVATGADVVILLNDDDNKVFMITLGTPPDDHTGVAHILEHSVLNGSSRYPVKEPFAELLKSSLYTFLNAMTYPDRTVYPVASRNDQDFQNLMDVYLDAVFNPLLRDTTFFQEGWHYHVECADQDLTYSGVVYNEMLGAYSDPETVLTDQVNRVLFPDSIYGLSSGGDPLHIPELNYEKFLTFHRLRYHPSNSRIFLFGAIDVEDRLAHLESYLGKYTYQEPAPLAAAQPRYDTPRRLTSAYPVALGESVENRTYALRSFLLGYPADAETFMSFSILARILGGTPASPLRKALIDSRLGESTLNYGFDHEIFDTYYSIGLKGTQPDRVDKMNDIIDDTLSQLVRDGLDQRAVEASVNSTEFHLREANFGGYPKGLCYGLSMLNSWMYRSDPLMHLRYESTLETIKKKIECGGYFEGMIQRHFIENTHQATVVLVPDATLETTRIEETRRRLADVKATLSADAVDDLVRLNRQLRDEQLAPDTAEALATIPKLSLDSIPRTAETYPFEILREDGYTLSYSEQPTSGICYLSFVFDTRCVPQDLLPYLPLFGLATVQTGTTKRDYVSLIQDIDIQTGGISSVFSATSVLGHPADIRPYLSFSGKCLRRRLPDLLDTMLEMLTACDYGNTDRIFEILHIVKSNVQSQIIPSGHGYVAKRLSSYHSRLGRYLEDTGGISQYQFLEKLTAEFDRDAETVIERLRRVAAILFRRSNLHIHLTGSSEEQAALNRELNARVAEMADGDAADHTYEFADIDINEGFVVPSKIQYVGKGLNLFDAGYTYNGEFEVLDTLLNRDYLWNSVRVQGGAYGCFTGFDRCAGNFHCVSYRDPNLEETLNVFENIGRYLSDLDLGDDDFEKLVIGTMGSIDTPRTVDQKGAIALSRYIKKITPDNVQHRRDQILSTKKATLRTYSELFRTFGDTGPVCVIGSEEKIKQDQGHLGVIRHVF